MSRAMVSRVIDGGFIFHNTLDRKQKLAKDLKAKKVIVSLPMGPENEPKTGIIFCNNDKVRYTLIWPEGGEENIQERFFSYYNSSLREKLPPVLKYLCDFDNANDFIKYLTKASDKVVNGYELQTALLFRSTALLKLDLLEDACEDALVAGILNPKNIHSNINAAETFSQAQNFYLALQFAEQAVLLRATEKAFNALEVTYLQMGCQCLVKLT